MWLFSRVCLSHQSRYSGALSLSLVIIHTSLSLLSVVFTSFYFPSFSLFSSFSSLSFFSFFFLQLHFQPSPPPFKKPIWRERERASKEDNTTFIPLVLSYHPHPHPPPLSFLPSFFSFVDPHINSTHRHTHTHLSINTHTRRQIHNPTSPCLSYTK